MEVNVTEMQAGGTRAMFWEYRSKEELEKKKSGWRMRKNGQAVKENNSLVLVLVARHNHRVRKWR